jgi:hypothetical protein
MCRRRKRMKVCLKEGKVSEIKRSGRSFGKGNVAVSGKMSVEVKRVPLTYIVEHV